MSGLLPDQGPCQLPWSPHSALARTAALMLVCVGGNSRDAGPSPVGPSPCAQGAGVCRGPSQVSDPPTTWQAARLCSI